MAATFKEILGRWPQAKDVANDCGVPEGTVRSWRFNNRIPRAYWNALVASAQRWGIEGVTPATLLAALQEKRAEKDAAREVARG